MTAHRPITVAGAGSIGCFVGGLLATHGHNVTLLARPRISEQIIANGLRLTDFGGLDRNVAAFDITLSADPASLATAEIILVTVKTADTGSIAQMIADHAPKTATVISLQNGMDASAMLRAKLPDHDVRAAMVPFNVVPVADARYHRASNGDIVIAAGKGHLAADLSSPDLVFTESDAIAPVQWGKLLINLNNALNALSGLNLQAQLLQRPWRRLMADQMAEALRVLKAHGIAPKSTLPVPMSVVPWVLRLPTPIFSRVASRMLTIDPTARASMSYDLAAGKPTEIDALQGVIIRMGTAKSVPTPLCSRVAEALRQVEANAKAGAAGVPRLAPSDLS